MKGFNSRLLLPIVTAIIGLAWVYIGLRYHGWWIEGRAASGFFPSLVGGLLALLSVMAIISELKEEPPKFFLFHVHPVLAAVLVVVTALLIGFFPALALYVLGWLKLYEKYGWRFSLSVTAVTTAGMYGIFYMWLRVPFPQGAILDLVLG